MANDFNIKVGATLSVDQKKIQNELNNQIKNAKVKAAVDVNINSKQLKSEVLKLRNEVAEKLGIEIDNKTALKSIQYTQKAYTDLRKEIYQSIGQKPQILQDMAKYYTELEQGANKTAQSVQKSFTEIRKEAYQSIGTKSPELSSMADYYSNLEKQSDSFYSKNISAIDIEIQKREEEAKLFSNQIKTQMEERIAAENKVQTELKQTAKEQQNALNLSSGKFQLDNRITSYITNNTKLSSDLKNKLVDIQSQIKSVDATGLKNLNTQFKNVKSSADALGVSGNTFFTTLKKHSSELIGFFSSATLVMGSVRTFQSLVSTVSELDKSLVDLQQSTGYTHQQAQELLNTYIDLGQELGATGTEVANSAGEWLRQGKSIADTNILIKDSMILSKIGQIDSAQATELLTSAMKGYKVEVSDVLGIIDKLSAVDLNSATDINGLATAMSRVASMASIAGVSMDKLLSYLAIVGETTKKDMASVGESFQTMFARMGNIKVGKFVDDETGESLNDVEKVLNNLGIKLRDSKNSFRDFSDVLDDIGAKWDGLSETEQNALGVAIAGTRQRENFTVLMENYSKSLDYTAISAQSSGQAMQKFAAYEESAEAKTKKIQASLQELATDTLNSQVIKSFLDASNALIKITDDVGIFNIALVSLAAILGAKTSLGLTSFANSLTLAIGNMGVATGAAETLGMALSTAIPVGVGILAIGGLVKLYDELNVTSKELAEAHSKSIEKVEDLSSKYKELSDTLETLKSKQNDVTEQLQDLYKLREKQTITKAEEDRLTQLENENTKLEKQIEYEKTLSQIAGQKAEKKAVSTLSEKTQSSIFTESNGKDGATVTVPLLTDSEKIAENTIQIKALNQEIQNYDNVINGIKLPVEQQEKYNKQLDYYKKALKDGLINEDQYNVYTKETKALLDGTLTYEDYIKKTDALKSKQSEYISQNSTLVDSLQSLNDKIVSTSGANYKLKVSNQAIIDDAKKSASAFGELTNILENVPEAIQDNVESTKKSLSDTITSLDDVSSAMTSLDTAFAKLKSKEKLDISDITGLQKAFGDTEGFDDFITIATSAKSVTSDVQDAFNDLVTTYINTTGVLDGLNDSNKDLITSQLELMGVTNAEAIVSERLAQQKLILADTGVDVSNATYDEISALLDEKDISDETRLALVDLATQKLGVNDVALSTSGDIQNLLSLMAASNATSESLQILAAYKDPTLFHGFNPGHMDMGKLIADAQAEVDAFYESLGGTNRNTTYSGGDKTRSDQEKKDKSTKDKSKKDKNDDPYLDKFNAEKDTLDHKLAMDEITEKTYYNKLEDLNNEYFKKHQKKYLSQYRQYQEEVHKGRKQLAEEAKEKALKEEEERLQKEEKRIDGIIEKYQKALSGIDDIASDSDNGSKEQISAYAKGIKTAGDEVSYLEAQITKLNKKYKDGKISQENYTEQLENLTDKLNDAKDTVKSYQDSIVESIKAQQEAQTDLVTEAYEKEKDAIEDRYDTELDSLNKIIDAKKKSLEADKDAQDYIKSLQEKTDVVSNIDERITVLSKASKTGDREAQAELQKLQEDRKKAQDELDELQADHKLKVEEDALDTMADNYKTQADKNKTIDLDNAKSVYDDKFAKINSLYAREEELIAHASEYTKKQFATSLQDINTQLSDLGINTPQSSTNALVNSYNSLVGASSGDSNDSKILSILSNGNGKGLGTSELNKYVSSNYGSQLSYSQMAQLATLLGINGVTSKNIVDDSKTKDDILKKLKKAGFKTGGVPQPSGISASEALNATGEKYIIGINEGESVLDVNTTKLLQSMNKNSTLPAVEKMLSNLASNTSNISNYTTNNSSPIINFNLNGGTITPEAMPQFNKWKSDIVSEFSKTLMNGVRKS